MFSENKMRFPSFRIAFFGVAMSTVATFVCIVTIPLAYNKMQQMQSSMLDQVGLTSCVLSTCSFEGGLLQDEIKSFLEGSDQDTGELGKCASDLLEFSN